jgi:WS/DGAT/MGAT family acyltransferase
MLVTTEALPVAGLESAPLSPDDLGFWYADQPRQRTTMAMLLLLDRKPDPDRLRAAIARMVEAVPRLRQRVVEAPFGLALPRWEEDPTLDLDFHVRRYSLADESSDPSDLGELFRTIGPIYERPFDRTRPLWEMIEIDRREAGAAIFFRLHHAVADGVGGNAILAALTDAAREGDPLPPPPEKPPGAWAEKSFASVFERAMRDRVAQDAARASAVAGALWRAVRKPSSLLHAGRILGGIAQEFGRQSESPLREFGRARRLAGIQVDFGRVREARQAMAGTVVDLALTAVAGAVGVWHGAHQLRNVSELKTLVPINLRSRAAQGLGAGVGNRTTGIIVRLPLRIDDPRARFREIHRRVEERKAHPAVEFFPLFASVLAGLPRTLYRALAYRSSQTIDLIVTNVPGVPVVRHLAGAEIEAAYPFAPVTSRCPVSIACYGYREHLFVGLDTDATSLPDVDEFRQLLARSFEEVIGACAPSSPPSAGSVPPSARSG